ncbi:MAG: RsmE family RNA methyltransferase [Desulfonatronovibrionaceae bacterium]
MYVKIHNFYLPPEKWQPPYSLTGREARHLSRVLRIKTGQTVRLYNGMGRSGFFTVTELSSREVLLAPREISQAPEPSSKIHLAVAWNKSLRRSWLLEKAVELGVWRIILWQGKRSQGKTSRARQDNWQGKMISALKQSENPWLPELIFAHQGVRELIEMASGLKHKMVLWEEETEQRLMDFYQKHRPLEKIIVAGPEGGLHDDEVAAFQESGFVTLSLGPRVLRWETAALAPLYLDNFFFS